LCILQIQHKEAKCVCVLFPQFNWHSFRVTLAMSFEFSLLMILSFCFLQIVFLRRFEVAVYLDGASLVHTIEIVANSYFYPLHDSAHFMFFCNVALPETLTRD
jgi:hypothetical protein